MYKNQLYQNQWSITKTWTLFYSYCYLQGVDVKKILKKHSLWEQALKKGEEQRVLGILYDKIYEIQKMNFQ